MKSENKKIIDFLLYSEKLKTEYRYASKNDGLRESAAEHSWRLALLVMLISPKLGRNIDLLKALKMAIIHDIVEIDAQDVMVLDHIDNRENKLQKDKGEETAIDNIRAMLGGDGDEIYNLWHEYLKAETYEAKILHVLNMIEGQTQFLSENVKKFTIEQQGSVSKLIAKTAKLSTIDPFIEQLYADCGDLFKNRTKPN